MPNRLTNTNINDTYKGLLHSYGVPLPDVGQVDMYDGVGTKSALKLGAGCNGATVCGTLTCGDLILTGNVSLGSNVVIGGTYIHIKDCKEVTLTSTENPLQIGNTNSSNIAFDCNEIQARNNNTAGTLHLNAKGGMVKLGNDAVSSLNVNGTITSNNVITGVSFNSTSSLRYKENVETLNASLDTVKKLRGVRFNWKDSGKGDIGFIAEEVNQIIPEIVQKNDKDEPISIDYSKITAVLVETVKELSRKIEILEERVK